MSRVEENDERSRTNNYEVIKELHHRIAELDGMLAEETRQLKEMTAQMEKTSLKKAIDLIMAQPPDNIDFDKQIADLQTCKPNALVNAQIEALRTCKKLINGLPDGYPMPLADRK